MNLNEEKQVFEECINLYKNLYKANLGWKSVNCPVHTHQTAYLDGLYHVSWQESSSN